MSASPAPTEQKVDAYTVVAADTGVDYDKLIEQFGASKLNDELLTEFEQTIGKPLHHFLRRRLVFSHRDLSPFLAAYKKGSPVYLYTGRGPSSDSMHLGHLIPFVFTKWLQEAFDCPLVVQLTDDEKSIFKAHLTPEQCHSMAISNAKDIISCGFDVDKTFIFSNIEYMGYLYPTVMQIQRCITPAIATASFGFKDDSGAFRDDANVLKMSFSAIQAAPSFSCAFPLIFPQSAPSQAPAAAAAAAAAPAESAASAKAKKKQQAHDAAPRLYPCLIPCAIDQDPYFRLTRDVAPMLKWPKPSLIHSSFLSALQGRNTKMSASSDATAIYLNETPEVVAEKVARFMNFEERDIAKSAVYEYLTFFLEDDELLDKIRLQMTGVRIPEPPIDVRAVLTKTLQDVVRTHQQRRALVTEDTVRAFMAPRSLKVFTHRPAPAAAAPAPAAAASTAAAPAPADATPAPARS